MKILASFLIAAYVLAGCAASAGNVSHADSEGSAKRDSGPMLCRDGSTPPCNDRD